MQIHNDTSRIGDDSSLNPLLPTEYFYSRYQFYGRIPEDRGRVRERRENESRSKASLKICNSTTE